ncbi:hypothetical protein SNE40_018098 [Patella caerulea]|uniref:Gag protein n=1 Tax=Patella caerulea TaxID=87958 RepID=A0AAN8J862_PATCE
MALEHSQRVKNLELQLEVMSLKLNEKLECTDDDKLGEIGSQREAFLETLKTRQAASNYVDTNIRNQVSNNESDVQPTPLKISDKTESSITTQLTCDVNKLGQLMARSTLPPPKPMVFKGDKLCYQKWRSSFKICFEKRTDDPDELLNYLAEYTSGEAFKLIGGNLHIPSIDNFNKAMAKLKEECGNPGAICTSYIVKLKDWEKIKPSDVKALGDLSNYLDSCYESLKSFGKINKLNESSVLTNAIDILPTNLKSSFLEEIRKIRETNSEPTFKDFVNFARNLKP